jgi:hypothetical protein
MVASGDDIGSHVEDLLGQRRCNAETSGGVLAIDNQKIDGVGFKNVGEMLAYDMAAGGPEDVADKEDVHLKILHCVKNR